VTEFGSLINCKNNLEEVIRRNIIGNRRHYGMSKLMKSQLLKRKTKCQLYKTLTLPTVLYVSESSALSKAHEALLGGFERRTLRRIYGAVQTDGVRERRYNKELYEYSLFNDVGRHAVA
jgi:hypothetical protein